MKKDIFWKGLVLCSVLKRIAIHNPFFYNVSIGTDYVLLQNKPSDLTTGAFLHSWKVHVHLGKLPKAALLQALPAVRPHATWKTNAGFPKRRSRRRKCTTSPGLAFKPLVLTFHCPKEVPWSSLPIKGMQSSHVPGRRAGIGKPRWAALRLAQVDRGQVRVQ